MEREAAAEEYAGVGEDDEAKTDIGLVVTASSGEFSASRIAAIVSRTLAQMPLSPMTKWSTFPAEDASI